MPSIEPRALNLYVKEEKKELFEHEFEKEFGKRKIITPYFTPFAGVNTPKYAYIMQANENEKGV